MDLKNLSINLCICGAAVISTYLYYQHRKRCIDKEARRCSRAPKRRPFITPRWLIKREQDLEPPNMTPEQIAGLHERKPPHIWNTVIIFPDLNQGTLESSTHRLVSFIKQARTSLYLCMYVCSNYILSNAVRSKYDDGLIVRCVSEYDTWTAHNNKGIKDLAKRGIEVHLNRNGFLMHNKFIIIDEEAVITGSLNWTRQGVQNNCENCMVTIDPRIVSKYVKEFNKLFIKCKSWEAECGNIIA